MHINDTSSRADIRYEPDERPSYSSCFGLGLQAVLLVIPSVVLVPVIIVRAAGLDAGYLSWTIFAALLVCGLITLLQSFSNRIHRRRTYSHFHQRRYLYRRLYSSLVGRRGCADDEPGYCLCVIPVGTVIAFVVVAPHNHTGCFRHGADVDCGRRHACRF